MPPSLDDSSFIVVGDVFDTDDDEDVDELSSVASERENASGTLILPSASTTTHVTFTPPSSVGSDIASLDLIHQHQRPLVHEDDDDMEGIADPLGLHVGPSPDVDGAVGATGADVPPSKQILQELSPATATPTPWTAGIDQARTLLQDRMPGMTSRRSLLFFYLPVLVAVLGVATYTKRLDTLRLRDLEIANLQREKEHQERIQKLQEEIEKLKKQQSGFTFTIPEPTWLKTGMMVDVSAESTTVQTLLKQWKGIKSSAYKTVDSFRTTLEKDLEEAKEWWKEKQRIVIEKIKTLEEEHDTSWASSHAQDEDEEESSSPASGKNNKHNEGGQAETGTDTAERKNTGQNLMPSKKTILASAAVVTVASVLLGTAIEAMFGNSGPSRLDYDTFDQTFGVPLVDFVE
jgi:hypothetical protein